MGKDGRLPTSSVFALPHKGNMGARNRTQKSQLSALCYQPGCSALCICVDKTGLRIVQNPSYNRAVPERPKARRKPTGCICTFKSSGGVSELQRNFPTRVRPAVQLNMTRRDTFTDASYDNLPSLLALKTLRHCWLELREPQAKKCFANACLALLHPTEDTC